MDPQTQSNELTPQELQDAMDMAGAMAYRYCRNDSEAAELRSAAYYGVVIAAGRFERARGLKFTTYAMHYILKYIKEEATWLRNPVTVPLNGILSKKGASRTETLPIDDFVEILPAPENGEMDAAEAAAQLHATLGKMDAKSARLLRQYFLEAMTLREIARLHGVSTETIRQRIEKAKERLRGLLKGIC